MGDINTCCISGNLAADPEPGSGVLRFPVAVNRSVRNEDGTFREEASFIDCKVFGNRAAALGRILSKGVQVTVQGELRQERWQAQDGQSRSKVVVVAREVKLPPRPRGGADGPGQPAAQAYQAQAYQPQLPGQAAQAYQAQAYRPPVPPPPAGAYDEEIPF